MAKKKEFTVAVSFTFTGEFYVKAVDEAEARVWVEKHCGMVNQLGAIHSTLPGEDIDWDFPVHPEKQILNVE